MREFYADASTGLPRTRGGSTSVKYRVAPAGAVCPAHAGVYLCQIPGRASRSSLPRTRGGLPLISLEEARAGLFAPHTRGSTFGVSFGVTNRTVCPAHAGVYLCGVGMITSTMRLPRTRGGLPSTA